MALRVDSVPFLVAGRWSEKNDIAQKSAIEKIKSYLKLEEGASMLVKAPQAMADFTEEALRLSGRSESAESLKKISKGFGSNTKGLFCASWFVGTIELAEQVSKVAEEGVQDGRFVELVRQGVKWTSTSCDSVLPYFLPTLGSSLKNIKDVTDLASDSIGAMQAAGGWVKADGELNRVNVSESPSAEVQDVLKAEKRLQFISLVKSVASAVVGVFLVFKLIVPTIVFLTFSLAISALSVTKHFFKANMIYKPLSDWKIAAPAA